ncbi:hypothetical protein BH10BAC2_BH10BAC2_44120 [soil metagenome]
MKRFFKTCFSVCLLLTGNKIFSQQVFHLNTEVAKSISAATYDHAKKAVMFFSDNNVFYYPVGSDKTVEPEWYKLGAFTKVDAALSWEDDLSLFFDGSLYRMFKHSTGGFITENTKWPNLPAAWNEQLDGAVNWDENLILFFYKNEYAIYNIPADSMVAYSRLTGWQGWPAEWNDKIDDAFNIGDGYIYFIRAGEIMPYSLQDKAFFNPLKVTPLADTKSPAGQSNSALTGSVPVVQQTSFTEQTKTLPGSTTITDRSVNNTATNNNNFTMSGCVTGNPGGGFRDLQSPVEGDEQGRLYGDNLPRGHKITEIKIYSSKIWGKNVISGIQCILRSPSGETVEQTALGRKTISEYSFKLDEDECITGISGTTNGEQGNFIYSIQITTSKRNSQVYGERSNDKVTRRFNLVLPGQSVFNGFVGNFNNNMTGIGLKYYGSESMGTSSSIQNTSALSNTGNNNGSNTDVLPRSNTTESLHGETGSVNNAAAPVAVTDGYLDNYEDYTKNLGNDAMWLVQPMPGLDWLGAGFDILRFDPLNPNETKNRKLLRGIVITNSGERGGNKAQYLKPYGAAFSSVNSGSDIDSNAWVSTYKEFSSSFSVGASGSVKVPEAGGGSLSGSYSEMSSASLGTESIYYFSKVIRRIHELDLEVTWRDENSGQRYKQKLNPNFKDDIAALPVMNGTIPNVDISAMQKGKPLPGGLDQLKMKYLDFIAKYGTHFASHVGWGGQYISRTQIKRSDYEASRMNKVDFTAQAEATIKKVKVGGEVKFGNSEGQSNTNSKSVFRRQIYVQGGVGETDEDKWRDKVDLTPAPVEIFFTPYADLLTKELFPNDASIEKKSRLLKIFTEKYLVDNMRAPVESKNDFFRDLPDLATPGSISVKDGGGYDMQFSITYELNGKSETKETGRYSIGRTMHLEVPVDSKNIKLKVEYFTGWLSDTKVIFEKNFATPELKCYKVWGTIFSREYGECEQ